MLGISFSPQNYHHHQQLLSKLRENNENDMTSAVWAGTVFRPRSAHVYGRSQLVATRSLTMTHMKLPIKFEITSRAKKNWISFTTSPTF